MCSCSMYCTWCVEVLKCWWRPFWCVDVLMGVKCRFWCVDVRTGVLVCKLICWCVGWCVNQFCWCVDVLNCIDALICCSRSLVCLCQCVQVLVGWWWRLEAVCPFSEWVVAVLWKELDLIEEVRLFYRPMQWAKPTSLRLNRTMSYGKP